MNELLLLGLLYYQVFGNLIVQYKFGINYGQIFTDYSSYGRNAVNGNSYLNTTYDTTPTDRGAYFNTSGSSLITLPPNNNITTQFLLTIPFTLNTWVFPEENGINSQYLFSRFFNNSVYMNIIRTSNNLQIQAFQSGNTNCQSTDSSFVSSKI
jgi:hypothetical protein